MSMMSIRVVLKHNLDNIRKAISTAEVCKQNFYYYFQVYST